MGTVAHGLWKFRMRSMLALAVAVMLGAAACGQAIPNPRDATNGRYYMLIHVPKTGGITYMMSMHSRYPGQPPIIIDNGENCYKFTKHSMRLEQFVTTTYLVRWPFSHAQSQYNMCTASAYARAELRPFHYGGAPLHNFSAWVDHYASLRQRPRSGENFLCYNPWNFATRLLSCSLFQPYDLQLEAPGPEWVTEDKSTYLAHGGAHDIIDDVLEPDLNEALKSLDEIELVGVMELMTESVCLIISHKEGGLPQECLKSCDQDHFQLHVPRIAHDVPPSATVHPDLRTMLQLADIVRVDFQLYQAAVKKFVSQLQAVSEASSTTLLCPRALEKVEMLIALGEDIYDHVDRGMPLSEALLVYDSCVTDLEIRGRTHPKEMSQRGECYYLAGDIALRTRRDKAAA